MSVCLLHPERGALSSTLRKPDMSPFLLEEKLDGLSTGSNVERGQISAALLLVCIPDVIQNKE